MPRDGGLVAVGTAAIVLLALATPNRCHAANVDALRHKAAVQNMRPNGYARIEVGTGHQHVIRVLKPHDSGFRSTSDRSCWMLPRNTNGLALVLQRDQDKAGYTAWVEPSSSGQAWTRLSRRTKRVDVRDTDPLGAMLEHYVGQLEDHQLADHTALPGVAARLARTRSAAK